jgi:uncharacterized protein
VNIPWHLRDNELFLSVRLTPKSSRDEIDGIGLLADGRSILKVRVRAVSENGKANTALLRLLAKTLRVPASAVRRESGASGWLKTLCVQGNAKCLAAGWERLCSGCEQGGPGHKHQKGTAWLRRKVDYRDDKGRATSSRRFRSAATPQIAATMAATTISKEPSK